MILPCTLSYSLIYYNIPMYIATPGSSSRIHVPVVPHSASPSWLCICSHVLPHLIVYPHTTQTRTPLWQRKRIQNIHASIDRLALVFASLSRVCCTVLHPPHRPYQNSRPPRADPEKTRWTECAQLLGLVMRTRRVVVRRRRRRQASISKCPS